MRYQPRKALPRYAALFTFLAALFLAGFSGFGESRVQGEDQSLLTLDHLFSSPEFRAEGFRPVKWLKDGSAYLTLEDSGARPGEQDLVRHDPASGRRTVVISAEQLLLPGQLRPLKIDDYELSPDERLILLLTNSRRVFLGFLLAHAAALVFLVPAGFA